ncbi:hypothetical protein QQ056_14260 [Oscillatoria laete-virens NRMC-F 0139]|nr:hypothetical protein [Oscillatoria laete-virens]MDL5054702.1 hypothetical protein [Oscillatoria laete-virens NRMC-F 0139]
MIREFIKEYINHREYHFVALITAQIILVPALGGWYMTTQNLHGLYAAGITGNLNLFIKAVIWGYPLVPMISVFAGWYGFALDLGPRAFWGGIIAALTAAPFALYLLFRAALALIH